MTKPYVSPKNINQAIEQASRAHSRYCNSKNEERQKLEDLKKEATELELKLTRQQAFYEKEVFRFVENMTQAIESQGFEIKSGHGAELPGIVVVGGARDLYYQVEFSESLRLHLMQLTDRTSDLINRQFRVGGYYQPLSYQSLHKAREMSNLKDNIIEEIPWRTVEYQKTVQYPRYTNLLSVIEKIDDRYYAIFGEKPDYSRKHQMIGQMAPKVRVYDTLEEADHDILAWFETQHIPPRRKKKAKTSELGLG
jgi:hypothetical protein